jgi:hypothetical protein
VFARNFEGLAVKATVPGPIMIPLINCCAINERATDARYPLPGSCLHANHKTVQDAPHRDQYGREKGGRGRLFHCPEELCTAMARKGPSCMPCVTARAGPSVYALLLARSVITSERGHY